VKKLNDRKQHVINKAHQLFVEKGFQATSIQDILDYSGISKGTFYNYFSSKNELLMAIFKSLNQKMDHEQNDLLIGQDPSNIEIFIKQLELKMAFNQRNKLLALFEEVFVSNDPTLKQFLKRTQIMHLRWTFNRFVDIFGESKQPYLLDCAIMFTGMLHHNIHYHFIANESGGNIKQVIRFTVERLEKMVEEVERNGDKLLDPEILEKWLPNCSRNLKSFHQQIYQSILSLKKAMANDELQSKYHELLDFILEEIVHSKEPRKFLIQSALLSLSAQKTSKWENEIQKVKKLVESFINQDSNK
jgi:AcrR family transcriptional regulator